MEQVTKKDIQDLKEGMGEMFVGQTKTLIEYVDGVEKRLTRKMSDLHGKMLEETQRKVDKGIREHVVAYHL